MSAPFLNLPPVDRKGFTIIEVMVVVVIMGIITTVVASLFAKGSFALRHGEAHNALQRANRLLTARVTPYIASAFRVEPPLSESPIVDPNTTDPGLPAAPLTTSAEPPWMERLRFITTEDFLAATYPDSVPTSALAAASFGDLQSHVYGIRLAPVGTLTPRNEYEHVVLEKLDPNTNYAVVGAPRVLYFGRDSARLHIDPEEPDNPPLKFYLSGRYHLIIEATMTTNIRSAGANSLNPKQVFRTTINLPGKNR